MASTDEAKIAGALLSCMVTAPAALSELASGASQMAYAARLLARLAIAAGWGVSLTVPTTENDDGTEHASGQPPKDRGPGGRSTEGREDLNRVGAKAPAGPPDDDAGQAQDPDVPELQRDVETLGERKWQDCTILEVLDCGGVEITGDWTERVGGGRPVVFLPLSGAIDLLDGLIDGLRAHGVQVDGFVTVTSEGGE